MTYPNVYENFDPQTPKLTKEKDMIVDLKGKWGSNHFKNENDIVLELACGRGEYTEALAEADPNKNFIGVDVKGARIWQGASNALKKGLQNAAFLRIKIEQIALFFANEEINEIWITFPDPFLRESKENKRLTAMPFLLRYKEIVKKGAIFHLKTDDITLYNFTIETLNNFEGANILYRNDNIYASELVIKELDYKTYYEKAHLKNERTIKYLRFTIN